MQNLTNWPVRLGFVIPSMSAMNHDKSPGRVAICGVVQVVPLADGKPGQPAGFGAARAGR